MWIAADFECMNVPVESKNNNFMDKLFRKPVAIGYNMTKILIRIT